MAPVAKTGVQPHTNACGDAKPARTQKNWFHKVGYLLSGQQIAVLTVKHTWTTLPENTELDTPSGKKL